MIRGMTGSDRLLLSLLMMVVVFILFSPPIINWIMTQIDTMTQNKITALWITHLLLCVFVGILFFYAL